MSPRSSRQAILQRLREKITRSLPIIGAGAGTGLSAKCEETGGADLTVCNSGRYRMAGRGSPSGLMACGNADEIGKGARASNLIHFPSLFQSTLPQA